MSKFFANTATAGTVPITLLTKKGYSKWLKSQPKSVVTWLRESGFEAAPGKLGMVSGGDRLKRVVAIVERDPGLWDYAGLSGRLPKGRYIIDAQLAPHEANLAALGWGLGTYNFNRYKTGPAGKSRPLPVLVWGTSADRVGIEGIIEASFLIQNLVDIPASDMGPEELASAAKDLAKTHGASCRVIVGDKLLQENYPLVHAVGRASVRAPRLIDLTWEKEGKTKAPLVTLVGKGVVFDAGGLNLKSEEGMYPMKGDMAGAAQALGLAKMIMASELNVRLRVLVPAVENTISDNAYRPSDILKSRKGLTVEVDNTDAEGRLILADALAEACAGKPDLLIDFATLTGDADAALGPDIPVVIGNDEKVCQDLVRCGQEVEDLVWQLPLHMGYRFLLDSVIADLHSIGSRYQGGGAITSALFLNEFVDQNVPWIHMDFDGLNGAPRPGRPKGAEARGIRACFQLLEERYGF